MARPRKTDSAPENDNATAPAPADERQETLPNVPRGTSDEAPSEGTDATGDAPADESAPYGRDPETGAPLNKDGSVRRKRGRKPGASAAPAGDAETAPRVKRKRGGIEITEEPPGYFSREADAIRCENAKSNAKKWLNVSRGVVRTGEMGARSMVRRFAAEGKYGDPAVAVVAAEAWPRLGEVDVREGESCETVLAQSLAIVAAYFAPDGFNPDHPLLNATISGYFAVDAYARAVETAMEKAVRAHKEQTVKEVDAQ